MRVSKKCSRRDCPDAVSSGVAWPLPLPCRSGVGPNQCEITGVFTTPDEKTMFVGIQHPGEPPDLPLASDPRNDPNNPQAYSSWPDHEEDGRPRSACIVITKDDGGEIGS